jgi:hypothetical protein
MQQPDWLVKWGYKPTDADGRIKEAKHVNKPDKEKKDAEVAEKLLDIPDVQI